MNKRIKRLWIKALRSGKFKQGVGAMKETIGDDFQYCCLGVLEELHVSATGNPFATARKAEYLSKPCREWAGLPETVADPLIGKTTASELNDNGKSFKYIANRIEKYL